MFSYDKFPAVLGLIANTLHIFIWMFRGMDWINSDIVCVFCTFCIS